MKLGPPDDADPDEFWERVAKLRREGLPNVTAISIARREALGIAPEDRVRDRAAHEPKLRTHPETEKMRAEVIKRAKR
jgi:hypothetical protein